MYCTKCGKKCSDEAKFCPSCGAPVLNSKNLAPDMSAQEDLPDPSAADVTGMPAGDDPHKGGNHSKLILWIILIVVIAAAVFAVVFYLTGRKPDEAETDYLEVGNAYMTEGDYEEAVVQFETAIDVDPKEVEPYLQLAEAYSELGETDLVEGALDDARQMVTDEYSESGTPPAGTEDLYLYGVRYYTDQGDTSTAQKWAEEGEDILAADESSEFADEAYVIIGSAANDEEEYAQEQEETEQSDDREEVKEPEDQSITAENAYYNVMDQLSQSGISDISVSYYDINMDGQDELIVKDENVPAVVNEDSPTQIYAFDGEKAVPLLDEEDLDTYNEYFIRIYPNGCIQTWCYDSDIYALKEEAYFIGEDGYSLDTFSGYWDTVENPDVTHIVEGDSEEVHDGTPAELKGLMKEIGDRQTEGTEYIDIDWTDLVIDGSGTVNEAVISEKNVNDLVSPLNQYITYVLIAYYYPNAYDSSEALNYVEISPAQVYALAGLALRDGYLLKSDPLADSRAVLPTELYQQYIDNMFGSEYSLDQFVPYDSPWGTVVEKNSSGEFVVAVTNDYGEFYSVDQVTDVTDTPNEKGVYTATVEYGVSYEGESDTDNLYMDFYLKPDDSSEFGCVIVGMNPGGFE